MTVPYTTSDGMDLDFRYLLKGDLEGVSGGFDDIGTAGRVGFGVGIPEPGSIPPGFTPLPGTYSLGHQDYGNFLDGSGSLMVYIPRCYFKIASGGSYYPAATWIYYTSDEDYATANGYVLERAFIDGDTIHDGIYVDKNLCTVQGGKLVSARGPAPMCTFAWESLDGGGEAATYPSPNYTDLNEVLADESPNYTLEIGYAAAHNPANRGPGYALCPIWVRSMLHRLQVAHMCACKEIWLESDDLGFEESATRYTGASELLGICAYAFKVNSLLTPDLTVPWRPRVSTSGSHPNRIDFFDEDLNFVPDSRDIDDCSYYMSNGATFSMVNGASWSAFTNHNGQGCGIGSFSSPSEMLGGAYVKRDFGGPPDDKWLFTKMLKESESIFDFPLITDLFGAVSEVDDIEMANLEALIIPGGTYPWHRSLGTPDDDDQVFGFNVSRTHEAYLRTMLGMPLPDGESGWTYGSTDMWSHDAINFGAFEWTVPDDPSPTEPSLYSGGSINEYGGGIGTLRCYGNRMYRDDNGVRLVRFP